MFDQRYSAIRSLFCKLYPQAESYTIFAMANTNRDIFGRELWLACRLIADAEALWVAYEHQVALGVQIENVSGLARQLAEAQGQWGRELWLCAWMVGCSTSLNYWYGVNETNALRDVFIVD